MQQGGKEEATCRNARVYVHTYVYVLYLQAGRQALGPAPKQARERKKYLVKRKGGKSACEMGPTETLIYHPGLGKYKWGSEHPILNNCHEVSWEVFFKEKKKKRSHWSERMRH